MTAEQVAENVDNEGWDGTILSPETCSVSRVNTTQCGVLQNCLASYEQCSTDGITTTGACCTAGDKCIRKDETFGMCVGQERLDQLVQYEGWDGTVIADGSCETFYAPGLICDRFHCIGTGERCSDDGISMVGTCCNPGDVCVSKSGYGTCASQVELAGKLNSGWTQLAERGCRLVVPTTCNAFWDFRARDPNDFSQMEAASLLKVNPATRGEYASVDLSAATMGAKLTLYAKADRAHGNADPRYVPLQFIPVPWQPAQITSIGVDPMQGIGFAGTGGGDPLLVQGINLAPSSHASCLFTDARSSHVRDSTSPIQIRVNSTLGWSSLEATRYTTAHGICPITAFDEPGVVNASAFNNPASRTIKDGWPVLVQNAAVVLRGGQSPAGNPKVVQHQMFLSSNGQTDTAQLSCPPGLALSSVEYVDWGWPNATCHRTTATVPGPDPGSCIESDSSLVYPDPAALVTGTRSCTSVAGIGFTFAQDNTTVVPKENPCQGVASGNLFGGSCTARGNECVNFVASTNCTFDAGSYGLAVDHLLEKCKHKSTCTVNLSYFRSLESPNCPVGNDEEKKRWLAVKYTCTTEWLAQDHIYGQKALASHPLNETGYSWAVSVKPAAAPLGSSQTIVAIEEPAGSALQFRSGLLWSRTSRACTKGDTECGTLAYYDACINSAPAMDSTGQTLHVEAKTWTRVAVSVSSKGEGSMYVNGVLSTRFTTRCLPDIRSSLFLGADHSGAHGISQNYFAGSLDEFQLWSQPKTAQHFWANGTCSSTQPSSKENLVVHYQMSASTGTKI
jgi:hypothetical protein